MVHLPHAQLVRLSTNGGVTRRRSSLPPSALTRLQMVDRLAEISRCSGSACG